MKYCQFVFVVYCLLQPVYSDFPDFVSGFGLTVTNFSKVNEQLCDVTVQSHEVKGDQQIRILLPQNYTTSGKTRRYPVLYLLHGGMGGAEDWTQKGGIAQQILGNLSLITIMPNGDPFGWYTNWVNPGKAAPQNWRTFHNEQVVPWIDANLRTVARKGGRAIAGLSMGGFGAVRYAEVYHQLYNYTASFSGAIDLLNWGVQAVIFGSEAADKKAVNGPFGVPFLTTPSSGWVIENPITHAELLRDVNIALYSGNQGIIELAMHDCNNHMNRTLNSLNIPHYYDFYGNGKSIGHGCHGKHEWPCWNAALMDVAPKMMAVLEQE
ncbi:unnamed protein product [Adineta ricciae]|uniref:Esterase n=1 Tax=Adineta ricciae TaxID=249248 RepID=A0A815A2M5_ADIRI|nr:unnamed protein product [Adineta ricciae]CAF1251179.1 unnamed protein product [Adineta ricciae]